MRVCVVTGSSRGIGRETAELLSRNGYEVFFSGTHETADVPADESHYIQCDISVSSDRVHLIDTVIERAGRLDLLVNNAGVAPLVRQDLLDMTEESYDRVMEINLKGMLFLTQYAAKRMIALKQTVADLDPRIVIVSSMSAYTSSISRGEYCISKAGVSMVCKLFADRLAQECIPVFEVRPGIIDTDMTSAVHEKYRHLIEDEGLLPIRRFGEPSDVARVVLAATSGLLDYGTGTVLNADGGFHIRRL